MQKIFPWQKNVAEIIRNTFSDIPEGTYNEPKDKTNARLEGLAIRLAELARSHGIAARQSTPVLMDVWQQGRPSSYKMNVKFGGYLTFQVSVLPR